MIKLIILVLFSAVSFMLGARVPYEGFGLMDAVGVAWLVAATYGFIAGYIEPT